MNLLLDWRFDMPSPEGEGILLLSFRFPVSQSFDLCVSVRGAHAKAAGGKKCTQECSLPI